MHYVRDYAFTEQHGGTKGESNDYLVMDEEQENDDELGQLRYVPVSSKLSLNKRFVIQERK